MQLIKWTALLIVLIGAGFGAYALVPKARTVWFLWKENERLTQEVRGIEERADAMNERLTDLDSPRVIEQEAKLRLQRRRPGEEVLVIVPPKEEATTTPTATPEPGFFFNIVDWVKGIAQ